MELQGQVAIIAGASGSVGGAVSRAFAEAGMRLMLMGRNRGALEALAADLTTSGHDPRVVCVDVGDPLAVAEQVQRVHRDHGRLDVVFNAVTYDDVQGESLADLDIEAFAQRMRATVLAQYGLTQAAAQLMTGQGHGAILTIVGHGPPHPGMGTTAASWALVEGMLRQWAADLGPAGVRVAWLRTSGFRESVLGHRDYGSSYAGSTEAQELLAELDSTTLLGRLPSLAEAGRAAVYLARAEGTTATAINLTAGAASD